PRPPGTPAPPPRAAGERPTSFAVYATSPTSSAPSRRRGLQTLSGHQGSSGMSSCTGWPVLRWMKSTSHMPRATITMTTASSTASITTNMWRSPSSTVHRRGLVPRVAFALDDGSGVDDDVAVGVVLDREEVQRTGGRARDKVVVGAEVRAVAVAGEGAPVEIRHLGHGA